MKNALIMMLVGACAGLPEAHTSQTHVIAALEGSAMRARLRLELTQRRLLALADAVMSPPSCTRVIMRWLADE